MGMYSWTNLVKSSNDIISDFTGVLSNIFKYNASVNFYMFHGGTNFGFMNGANHIVANNIMVFPFYAPDVTSYGNYTLYRPL